MPLKISDTQLADAYSKLQAANKKDASVKIDDTNVLQLLAAVGDSSSTKSTTLLSKLSAQGMTRQQQFDLVNKGMSKTEKSDLGKILDQGDVPLTTSAKNFLEALTGRGTLDGGQPALSLTFDPKKGITGALATGSTLEAINLSTAPGERLHLEDTVEVGTGDKFGKFMTGANAADFMKGVQEGDVIRYRTRDSSGKASDWVTVTAHTDGAAVKDTRDAVVALKRITLGRRGRRQESASRTWRRGPSPSRAPSCSSPTCAPARRRSSPSTTTAPSPRSSSSTARPATPSRSPPPTGRTTSASRRASARSRSLA